MIQQMSFLGIPLRTQLQRRMLVVGYYVVIFGFAALAFCKTAGRLPGFMFPQIFFLGSLLGGISIDRPVKPYTTAVVPGAMDSSPISLNLNGRRAFGSNTPQSLDEREQGQRDHAHFLAYRILMLSLMLGMAIYLAFHLFNPAWINVRVPVLAWTMVVYAISLPQSVLLWTELPVPMADIIPMHHA